MVTTITIKLSLFLVHEIGSSGISQCAGALQTIWPTKSKRSININGVSLSDNEARLTNYGFFGIYRMPLHKDKIMDTHTHTHTHTHMYKCTHIRTQDNTLSAILISIHAQYQIDGKLYGATQRATILKKFE